jgi:class 3 adenylate cyclase
MSRKKGFTPLLVSVNMQREPPELLSDDDVKAAAAVTDDEFTQLRNEMGRKPMTRLGYTYLKKILGTTALWAGTLNNARRLLAHCTVKSQLHRAGDLKNPLLAAALWKQGNHGSKLDEEMRLIADEARVALHSYYTCQGKSDPIRLEMYPGSYKVHLIDRRVTVCVEEFLDCSPRTTADIDCLRKYVHGEIKRRLGLVPGIIVADAGCRGGAGPRFCVRGQVVPLDEASPQFWFTIGSLTTGRTIATARHERHRDDASRFAAEISEWILQCVQTKVEIDLLLKNRKTVLPEALAGDSRELAQMNGKPAGVNQTMVDVPGRRIEVVCGLIDIKGSTPQFIANPNVGPNEGAEALLGIDAELRSWVRSTGGKPISFTGDGLLFYWDEPAKPTDNVRAALQNPEVAVGIAIQGNIPLRNLLRKMKIDPPKLRIAITSGEVYLGKVGSSENIIGLPVVEAARLAALKEEYEKESVSVLITRAAHNHGTEWRMWDAGDFQPCASFTPQGTGLPLKIFKPA